MNNFSPLDFDLFCDFSSPKFTASSSTPSVPTIKNPLNSLPDLGDHKLETEDPTPDIWEMFHDFDQRFFNGTLVSRGVEVDWSQKMTLCAGLCRYSPGTYMCSIKLSKPLLQLRSRKDLVETLIHEMIHALLFVLHESDNRESHGPKFHENMYRINRAAKLNISVYHTFHDEVNHYKTHVWKCNGACRNRAPYFGTVKRSMNRKPGPYDPWFAQHQQTCGGVFEKISEPENQTKSLKKTVEIPKTKDIRNFFTPTKLTDDTTSSQVLKDNGANKIIGFDDLDKKDDQFITKIIPFSGVGHALGSTKNSQPGRSVLLTKFGKNLNVQATTSTVTSSMINDKTKATSKDVRTSTNTNQIDSSFGQLIVLDDRDDRNKSPVDHFNETTSSKNKRLKIHETIILSDDDDDDEDYAWLKDLSNEELMTISQTGPIVIDD